MADVEHCDDDDDDVPAPAAAREEDDDDLEPFLALRLELFRLFVDLV